MTTGHELELIKLAVQLVTNTSQGIDPDKVRDHIKKNFELLRSLDQKG